MRYGGDYNPEQWPEEVWVEDVRLMAEAGVNFVTVGVFSWALLEPEEGRFQFGWLDRVLDLLHSAGIAVDLATATASPPAWMPAAYPEILPEDENGVRRWPGSRQHYAPTSPVYRRFAARLTRKMAERYGNHPALTMWHINNEYGCHTNLDYSDVAATAFRRWLTDRYSTIAALNRAWGTSFWSQKYTGFEQILPPRVAPNFRNPTQVLDFRRFSSHALLECFLMEKAIVREITPDIPVTTNFIGAFKPVDYWSWAPHLDIIADDNYPDSLDPRSAMKSALTRDLMRSLGGGKPWLLMEQSTGRVQWRTTNARKPTGLMQSLSLQAVSRGADGINFFQWRQSRAGAEKFHTAMIPHSGTDTRIWRSVVELGHQLAALAAVEGTSCVAKVAIVLDWNAWWALENDGQPQTLSYLDGIETWYEALYSQNVAVDFASPDAVLTDYAVVVAPQLYLVTEENARRLADYVRTGGTLVMSYYSGIVDGNDHAYLDGYFGPLQPALGIRVEEFAPLALSPEGMYAGIDGSVEVASESLGDFVGTIWSEFLNVDGAEVLGHFHGGDLDGSPAVTRNVYGRGAAWYVATQPGAGALRTIMETVLAEAKVLPVVAGLPAGVEAQQRGTFLFLLNQGTVAADTGLDGYDLLTRTRSHGHTLAPHEVLVLDVSKGLERTVAPVYFGDRDAVEPASGPPIAPAAAETIAPAAAVPIAPAAAVPIAPAVQVAEVAEVAVAALETS
jgi:beta-galactosidase